jgi:hypothetical protein
MYKFGVGGAGAKGGAQPPLPSVGRAVMAIMVVLVRGSENRKGPRTQVKEDS